MNSNQAPDPAQARRLLEQADRSHRDASHPRLSPAVTIASALAAGLGVAALGQRLDLRFGHALMMLVGVALLAVAFVLPVRARNARGLRGFSEQVRTHNNTYLVVCAVLVVCALQATATTAVVYALLGVATVIAYFLVLRGRLQGAERLVR